MAKVYAHMGIGSVRQLFYFADQRIGELKQKIKEEIAYAKDRMITYDENRQTSNSDVELGVARGLTMALDFIKEEELEKA